jgi:hypothetical protein
MDGMGEDQQYGDQSMYYAMDDSIARKVEQDRLDKIYYDSHHLVQKLAV